VIKKVIEKIKTFFRNIKLGIPNLIKWFPVIWKDRDWDQHFLYVILQFKLKQMEQLQRKYGISANRNDYADQMKTCIILLDRIIKSDYLINTLKPHEEKWGESKLNFKKVKDRSELFEGIFTVEKVTNKKEKDQEHKDRMRLYKHVDNLEKQDLDLLFKNMRKYVEWWWD
jgi:hypothetical protein